MELPSPGRRPFVPPPPVLEIKIGVVNGPANIACKFDQKVQNVTGGEYVCVKSVVHRSNDTDPKKPKK